MAIVLWISKFQSNLLNKRFLLRIDCKSVNDVLQKDVKNLVSKQVFARWQEILSVFDFEIDFIKGTSNLYCNHNKFRDMLKILIYRMTID